MGPRPRPVLGVRMWPQMHCVDCDVSVPMCAYFGPVASNALCKWRCFGVCFGNVQLPLYCLNGTGLVPALGVQLHMYCVNGAVLVPVLAF